MNRPIDSTGPVSCHSCGSASLNMAPGFERLGRVTSDCKPFPAGGRLACCPECGLVQTPASPEWLKECNAIYSNYSIYYQSGGIEQPVFSGEQNQASARSECILRALMENYELPKTGRWLDFGCGNGSLLTSVSRRLPGWNLFGAEFDAQNKAQIEAIPGVVRLYTCALADIPGPFDAISLVHVLEHIPSPRSFLREVFSKLADGGMLIVEVPDCLQNPFMLPVADHCSHFSLSSLRTVAACANYKILHSTNEWVRKELTLVGRKQNGSSTPDSFPVCLDESQKILDGVPWLQKTVSLFKSTATEAAVGIFGTSIAATWLDSQCPGIARFFVDEDPSRIGKQHLARPVLSPADVPGGAGVFLALPSVIANSVGRRLTERGISVILPPS
jgi:SAM-dependent methyltransferase